MLATLLQFIAISALITATLPLALIASQRPSGPSDHAGLDFGTVKQSDTPVAPPDQRYTAPDGAQLGYRWYPSARADAPIVMMLHGSSWHGLQFDTMARDLAQRGTAHVAAPDLRGHGFNAGKRGDLDYIGQFEDDISALIATLRASHPGSKVILGGHSSGGGLAVRYAGSRQPQPDGFILLAPFLKYNAPTTRPNSGGWANPLTRRIIGLSMLNSVGITALNHLTVIEFNVDPAVRAGPLGHTLTESYSYRLNTAYAPHSAYLKDIAALGPFALIVGENDEAFIADRYQPVMSEQSDQGRYSVVPGLGHLAIVNAPETRQIITGFLYQVAGTNARR